MAPSFGPGIVRSHCFETLPVLASQIFVLCDPVVDRKLWPPYVSAVCRQTNLRTRPSSTAAPTLAPTKTKDSEQRRQVLPFFFFIPFIMFALLFSLPPSRNSDPGSYSRLFSPLVTTVRALHYYYGGKISARSSLLRLVELCLLCL